jgi:hypothetical protein
MILAVEVTVIVAVEVETSRDVLPLPEIKAATQTDSVNPPRDVTLTLMCRLVIVEPVNHPDLLHTLALHLALDPPNHHHPAAVVMSPATGPANAVAAPPADQYLPSDGTAEEREGPARTTVTVLDPDPFLPAVPRAHVPSEETAAAFLCLLPTTNTQETLTSNPSLVPPRGPAAHLEGPVEIAIPAA